MNKIFLINLMHPCRIKLLVYFLTDPKRVYINDDACVTELYCYWISV